MLIFSSVGAHAAATGRVVDTLVGAAAGLAGGLIFAGKPRVQPARAAVGRLAGQVAGLLDRMASDLAGERTRQARADDLTGEAAQWLAQARALRDEIERVDDTLREAAESARLNPRALGHAVRRGAGHRDDGGAARRPRGPRARGADAARPGPLGPRQRRDRTARPARSGTGRPGSSWRACSPSSARRSAPTGGWCSRRRRAASRWNRSSPPSSRRRTGSQDELAALLKPQARPDGAERVAAAR